MAREVPKVPKLAADMTKQFSGYRIKVVPMIIGALGTVETSWKTLGEFQSCQKCSRSDESLSENCSLFDCEVIEATSIC